MFVAGSAAVGTFVKLLVALPTEVSVIEITAVIAVGTTSDGVFVAPDATIVGGVSVTASGEGAPTSDNTMPKTTANAMTPMATTAINNSSPKSRCTVFSSCAILRPLTTAC